MVTSNDTGARVCPMPTLHPLHAYLSLLVGILHVANAAISTPELGQLPLCGPQPLLEGIHSLLEALCCRQDLLQAAIPAWGVGEPGRDSPENEIPAAPPHWGAHGTLK